MFINNRRKQPSQLGQLNMLTAQMKRGKTPLHSECPGEDLVLEQ